MQDSIDRLRELVKESIQLGDSKEYIRSNVPLFFIGEEMENRLPRGVTLDDCLKAYEDSDIPAIIEKG